ncbi:Crp/Fnr family transcriptional regulator [Brevibacillus fulvus]|uniref:CRP/FNR family transcriptional regulator n=1 Tax=Brevibacillus fulvus TaxID=1125967 RepID=A0A939BSC8_9BACL|nr:Crp/Fnr family transcriptional regulator [Brevibacillus fulvus]MBM7590328.1 CRP/FNR family transcriptional regulator [Brevibacillus fulvus]
MYSNEPAAALRSVPLFRNLDSEELAYLNQITVKRFFRKKSVIFSEGAEKTEVFFIAEGLVRTYKVTENGNEQTVSLLRAGEMFPHVGFFHDDPYPATAEALIDTQLLIIPVHKFEQLMLQKPTIAVKVMKILGEKIKELQERLQVFSANTVDQRVIAFLCKLAEQYVPDKDGVIKIHIPMTHQEIATLVGTTRETINRFFNRLQKEGVAAKNRTHITILNFDRLKQWSDAN